MLSPLEEDGQMDGWGWGVGHWGRRGTSGEHEFLLLLLLLHHLLFPLLLLQGSNVISMCNTDSCNGGSFTSSSSSVTATTPNFLQNFLLLLTAATPQILLKSWYPQHIKIRKLPDISTSSHKDILKSVPIASKWFLKNISLFVIRNIIWNLVKLARSSRRSTELEWPL